MEKKEKYKVVLVDDERIILKGLSTVIPWEKEGCIVVGTAHDGHTGLRVIRELQPDMVITDIRMPNMDGLTMIAALNSEYPRMQTTVLTAYRDFDYAKEAIRLGVCRFLLKPSKLDEITEAIQAMRAKLEALPPLPVESDGAESTEDAQENSVSQASSYIVKAALNDMREHCTEPHISLSQVADRIYVSQWHLSKLLNKETGQGFFDILSNMRIEKAKELLMNPLLRIHEIAEIVGYSDVAHFSRNFKKYTGMTPGEWRNHAEPAMIKDPTAHYKAIG